MFAKNHFSHYRTKHAQKGSLAAMLAVILIHRFMHQITSFLT